MDDAAFGHKYEVISLVKECAARLQAKLTAESAAKMLIEADKLEIEFLKISVLDFIVSNSCVFKKVRETEGYHELPAPLLDEMLAHAMGMKKRRREPDSREFPDGTHWTNLTVEQLWRALGERGLDTCGGDKLDLVTRLQRADVET